jgi:hypothetical protein
MATHWSQHVGSDKLKKVQVSLHTGLTLLTSLATQLGFPQDDGALPQEAMKQLLHNRMAELQECRRVQDVNKNNVPSKWRPFLNAVRLTLEKEEDYLSAAVATAEK